jgi:hypothetical protein
MVRHRNLEYDILTYFQLSVPGLRRIEKQFNSGDTVFEALHPYACYGLVR